jgi:hypothetical protein
MHEKASLRKYLESWRGKRFDDEQAKAFDVTVLIGKACMVNIVHIISNKGTTYADITAITPLPKGLECPPQINKTFILSYDNFDHEGFEKLPDYIKNKVKSSAEYKRMMDPNKPEPEQKEKLVAPNGEEIDDLPF